MVGVGEVSRGDLEDEFIVSTDTQPSGDVKERQNMTT